MRFMVIVKASKDSEAGKMPSEEMLAAMGRFNEELVKAGVMVDGAGLQSSAKGARITFKGKAAPSVTSRRSRFKPAAFSAATIASAMATS